MFNYYNCKCGLICMHALPQQILGENCIKMNENSGFRLLILESKVLHKGFWVDFLLRLTGCAYTGIMRLSPYFSTTQSAFTHSHRCLLVSLRAGWRILGSNEWPSDKRRLLLLGKATALLQKPQTAGNNQPKKINVLQKCQVLGNKMFYKWSYEQHKHTQSVKTE